MHFIVWPLLIGITSAVFYLFLLIFSYFFPERRLWPLNKQTSKFYKILIWLPTVLLFVAVFFIGIVDWNSLQFPEIVKWGIGLPLVLIGTVIIWRGVFEIGPKATSGEVSTLQTKGLYKYSRNPQYMADIGILSGWFLFCASAWSFPIVLCGILNFIIAPFIEEPWLHEKYGKEYDEYRSKVRRFL